jgi:hypothetical protein
MFKELIGKNVMIRTYSAGVHFGELAAVESAASGFDVKLKNATRVYSWTGANSLSQLALEGSKRTDSELSVQVPSIGLRAIEIIEMTPEAYENLINIKTWKYEAA